MKVFKHISAGIVTGVAVVLAGLFLYYFFVVWPLLLGHLFFNKFNLSHGIFYFSGLLILIVGGFVIYLLVEFVSVIKWFYKKVYKLVGVYIVQCIFEWLFEYNYTVVGFRSNLPYGPARRLSPFHDGYFFRTMEGDFLQGDDKMVYPRDRLVRDSEWFYKTKNFKYVIVEK